jgi:endonuclease G
MLRRKPVIQQGGLPRGDTPVLAIRDNDTKLEFVEKTDSDIWLARLTQAKPLLDTAIRAVGRIDLQGGRLDWVGTGWLVAENILVTNRHVACEFAMRRGNAFTFKTGTHGLIAGTIDFLQEIDNPALLIFKLIKPLHIEPEPGPDLAFFEVETMSSGPKLAAPIELADQIRRTQNAATIGYPAYDSRVPEPVLMEDIFGKTYNKKRLAPGGVIEVQSGLILHNCTTLGGNSGSAVIDLDSGKALGLHFSGSFLATNYAIRTDVVKRLLDDVRGRKLMRGQARISKPALVPIASRGASGFRHDGGGNAGPTTPLTVTASLGSVLAHGATPLGDQLLPSALANDYGGAVDGDEAIAEDYRDRTGYQADFLGKGNMRVALPSVQRHANDVFDFSCDGKTDTELRYEHYSVVMSRRRRMCFFSAVNINENLSKKSARVGWKWDPRIPKSQQIMNECYGNPPKFSRGHMTRREDPGWGKNAATAKRGNEDSMHVTNTAPQMQAFNAPVWLALEDYALGHAKEDAMRISVFTGPYFSDHDPEMNGVKIPLAYLKIIAFVHDETGELCATGYDMDQESTLQPDKEFVFGAFSSPQLSVATQVSIQSIEARSGVSFGKLARIDPLARHDEGFARDGRRPPLLALEQIQFVR